MPAPSFDHVVYATPDLARSVDALERMTGVRAAYGGQHVGLGTHNAMLGLGGDRYLEILGPVPDAAGDASFAAMLRALDAPRNHFWAVRTADLAALRRRALAAGYDPGGIVDMARTQPDGVELTWQMTLGGSDVIGGVIPFGIQWRGEGHPAATAPGGCRLAEFRAEHPEPERVRHILAGLQVEVAVGAGSAPALAVAIDTPKGRVDLR